MARPGFEPGTPRFSVDPDTPLGVWDASDFCCASATRRAIHLQGFLGGLGPGEGVRTNSMGHDAIDDALRAPVGTVFAHGELRGTIWFYVRSQINGPAPEPYTPGSGIKPKRLAGRDSDLDVFGVSLASIADGQPERSLIYSGLRGVGKTVLVRSNSRQASRERPPGRATTWRRSAQGTSGRSSPSSRTRCCSR